VKTSFTLKFIQYGGKHFTKPAMHICCTVLAHDQESVADDEDPQFQTASALNKK